jgi:hypothetical protein
MRDHERELIAALVEGRLDDESEARALVASSPELHEEYEAQLLAHRALTGAGSVSLSEAERAELHRDVWTALRHRSEAPARGPWYLRAAAVAAGLFVVVGLAAVLSTSGGPDAGSVGGLAADLDVGPTSEEDEEAAGAPSDDSAGSDGAETFEDAATTTAAASELESPGDEAIAVYRREAELIRQGIFSERLRSFTTSDRAYDDHQACVEEAGLNEYRVLATLEEPAGTSTTGDSSLLAVVIPVDAQLDSAPIAFVDLDVCEVVYIDE